MLDIFLSRPNWIEDRFGPGLKAFMTRLSDSNLNPRTLGVSDSPIAAPLDEVVSIMRQCRGAIILGYPQVSVTAGTIKGKPLEPTLHLGTEWNHIEAGLAYASKLPLLIVHHVGVSRGVFDRGVLNGFIYELDLADSGWCQSDTMSRALSAWRSRVGDVTLASAKAHATVSAPEGAAPCPNCSSPDRPFYMSPLDRAFAEVGTHRCARCRSTFRLP